MTNAKLIALLFTSIIAFSQVSVAAPLFEDYIVDNQTEASLQHIDFGSHKKARMFRSLLKSLIGSKPNYAGHFVLSSFGCGTSCQGLVVVDTLSGKVMFPESSSYGYCSQPNSQLLVINPYIAEGYDEVPGWAYVYYYVIENNELVLLKKSKQDYAGVCDSGE